MGYDLYRETDGDDGLHNYFRLNVWGMSEARGELVPLGIVRPSGMPMPPDAEQFGITEHFDSDDEDALTPAQREYVAALKQWRDGHEGEGPGIPIYKLGSNDGWLVTPVEIRSGVLWADAHHPGWRDKLACTEVGQMTLEFVEWMEGSPRGFRVW